MKPGYELAIQRLGHWQLTWDGVDNEDTSWRLVGSRPSYAVPQREVFISIGPDLRVKKTITLNKGLNKLIIRDRACHTSQSLPVTNVYHLFPENPWSSACPAPFPCCWVMGFKTRCHLSPEGLGAMLTSKRTHTRSSAKVKIKEHQFLNRIKVSPGNLEVRIFNPVTGVQFNEDRNCLLFARVRIRNNCLTIVWKSLTWGL